MLRARPPLAEFLRRLLAAGNAGLVLALAMFAVSPELHGKLHDAEHANHDDACAVALFSGGVALPIAAIEAKMPAIAAEARVPVRAEEICFVAAHYRHPPERGPPAGPHSR